MRGFASSVIVLGAAALTRASPAHPPEAAITPRALLPRENWQTLGFYSSSTLSGTTIWAPWEEDADKTTYTTAGSYFRRCGLGSVCPMFTDCSAGYMVAASTSSFCGSGPGASASQTKYCSSHLLLSSMGDSSTLKWIWCDDAPLTGYTFFAKNPALASATTTGPSSTNSVSVTRTGSSQTSATNSNSASSSATSTGTPLPASSSSGSDTPVGAIAGGVVGGVAVLGAIAFAIFFIMRRDKKKKEAQAAAPLMGQTTPYQQQAFPNQAQTGYYGGATAYQDNEQKPTYYAHNQAQSPYPTGPYDPHMSPQQQYGTGLPPQELNAVQYAPQELPTQQPAPKPYDAPK